MSNESDEKKQYPVTSLHDFLFELDKEWSKFRNGSIIGLVSSGILFILVVIIVVTFQTSRIRGNRF